MAKHTLPPVDLLRQLLRYDEGSGRLYWIEREPGLFSGQKFMSAEACAHQWNERFAGKEADKRLCSGGYRQVKLSGVVLNKLGMQGAPKFLYMLAHRTAWVLHFGSWPAATIDHINGDRLDNSASNLREVAMAENLKNKAIQKNNQSGHIGVRDAGAGKWRAGIHGNGKAVHLGTFDTIEEAIHARTEAQALYGYHENHGRSDG